MTNYICLSLVILVACVEISTGYLCKDSHCQDDECSAENVCANGCQIGFDANPRGQCVQECPDNCKDCEDFVCVTCVFGHYGNNCTMTCDGCVNGECDFTTGQCTNGCKEGYGENPWCNVIQSRKSTMRVVPVDADATERSVYIWIASCLISAVIVAVIVVIIFISLQRKRGWKSYDVQFEQTRYHRPQTGEERVEMNVM